MNDAILLFNILNIFVRQNDQSVNCKRYSQCVKKFDIVGASYNLQNFIRTDFFLHKQQQNMV